MLKNEDLYDLSLDELFQIIKNNNLKFDYLDWLRIRILLIEIIERSDINYTYEN